MEKEIKLESRDGTDNRLINVGGNNYVLVTPYNYRVGFDNKGVLYIDPSGGPMLAEGRPVGNNKVIARLRKVEMVLIELADVKDLSSNSST